MIYNPAENNLIDPENGAVVIQFQDDDAFLPATRVSVANRGGSTCVGALRKGMARAQKKLSPEQFIKPPDSPTDALRNPGP